jgi:mRNA-degrading endonuclease YafQ of YafQ-DinJ toxin-antitoxin module
MFEFSPTGQFKRDLKSSVKRNYDITKLEEVLNLLRLGKKLPPDLRIIS